MPIRPIDMQVAIPKLGEVARMSQLEQQKAGLQQSQTGVTNEKNTEREHRSVSESQTDNKSGSEADARKKGRNAYSQRQKNKKDGEQPKQPEISSDGRQHRIDIQI